jgi:uncharacterized membrane protein
MGTGTATEGTPPTQPSQPGQLASPPGAAESAGNRRSRHLIAVGALTAIVAILYCVFALTQFYTFRTSSYDLVIFDEAVRSYSHFLPGTSIIKGLHNGFGPHFSELGDHWSPILAALAPLYWIYSGPQTLLVAQAVLFALAIPPLWVFTRRAFGGGRGGTSDSVDRKATVAAYLVSVAYALSWPIASALAFDFHEVAFAPVLIAVALERLQAGRLRTALIALAALLLVKEDMGLLVAGIGLYLAVARPRVVRRQLLVACILIVGGILDTVIATYVLIPAFGGRSDYYWAYTALGMNGQQAVVHLISHPLGSLKLLITPRVKLITMLWLFGAFCFLPLRSPIALATIPLLLERMMANLFGNWWVTSFQYNAYLVIILACAAVDGAARLDRSALLWRYLAPRRAKQPAGEPAQAAAAGAEAEKGAAGTGSASPESTADDHGAGPAGRPSATRGTAGTLTLTCAGAMCAVAVFLVPRFGFGPALRPAFYHRTPAERSAAAAAAAVPNGVVVAAAGFVGPALSARDTVLLWDGDGGTPPLGAPWVVANVRSLQFTFHSVAEQKQRVALLERNGYRVVFRRRGYIVLHRSGPARIAASVPFKVKPR